MKIKHSRGFTLIELLVGCVITALILVMVVKAVDAVTRIWDTGTARIDNFSKARVILSLLDRDIQSAVLRPDLAAFVSDTGDNALAFYTQIRGGSGNRRLSLVRYGLTNSASNSLFQRADYGLGYDKGTLSLSNTSTLPDLSKSTIQDMTDGILRFEWMFVTADGSYQSSYQYDYSKPDAADNTRAIIVSMLILDDRSFRLATQTDSLANLLSKFSDTLPQGKTYGTYWNGIINDGKFAANLPKPVSAGVRVFERKYLLH